MIGIDSKTGLPDFGASYRKKLTAATMKEMLKKLRKGGQNASKFMGGGKELAKYQKPNKANEASLFEKAKYKGLDSQEEYDMTLDEYSAAQEAGKKRDQSKASKTFNPAIVSTSGDKEYMGVSKREKEAWARMMKLKMSK
jgi:hypothetical protein